MKVNNFRLFSAENGGEKFSGCDGRQKWRIPFYGNAPSVKVIYWCSL